MYVLQLVVQSLESPKGPGKLTLMVFLWNSYPLQGLQSFPLFFHKSPQAPSTVWLWVSMSESAAGWNLTEDNMLLSAPVCMVQKSYGGGGEAGGEPKDHSCL